MYKLNLPGYLVDTHCHLNDLAFDHDRDAVVQRAVNSGVEEVWDVAVDLESSHRAIANAQDYLGKVKAWIGVDPEVVSLGSELTHPRLDEFLADEGAFSEYLQQVEADLVSLVVQNKEVVAGLGETGIDDYWLPQKVAAGEITSALHTKLIGLQIALFKVHLSLAERFDLPLSVHSRGAEKLALDIAADYKVVMILHSFTGSLEIASEAVKSGHYLGINAISTFKNAHAMRQMWKELLPALGKSWSVEDFYNHHIVFETDAPYLAPDPWRGERNEPQHVKAIVQSFKNLIV